MNKKCAPFFAPLAPFFPFSLFGRDLLLFGRDPPRLLGVFLAAAATWMKKCHREIGGPENAPDGRNTHT